ncbi:LuxR family quorum-sensing system transcriptional regulator SolR [Paraburkholderia sp. GAS41]
MTFGAIYLEKRIESVVDRQTRVYASDTRESAATRSAHARKQLQSQQATTDVSARVSTQHCMGTPALPRARTTRRRYGEVMMDPLFHDAYQRFLAAKDEDQLFQQIASFAEQLGFEYCCYGIRMAVPVSKPVVAIFDTYPDGWMEHYQASSFLDIDPTVRQGMRGSELVVWPASTDGDAKRLWSDAHDFGLKVGAAQSSWAAQGAFGLLTLSRPADALKETEVGSLTLPMNWLANVSHTLMSRFLMPVLAPESTATLTLREREVLCWTGEGKTSYEIGQILNISERTVNFHVNNVLLKLAATNKTQAVVKAIAMGLIYTA